MVHAILHHGVVEHELQVKLLSVLSGGQMMHRKSSHKCKHQHSSIRNPSAAQPTCHNNQASKMQLSDIPKSEDPQPTEHDMSSIHLMGSTEPSNQGTAVIRNSKLVLRESGNIITVTSKQVLKVHAPPNREGATEGFTPSTDLDSNNTSHISTSTLFTSNTSPVDKRSMLLECRFATGLDLRWVQEVVKVKININRNIWILPLLCHLSSRPEHGLL